MEDVSWARHKSRYIYVLSATVELLYCVIWWWTIILWDNWKIKKLNIINNLNCCSKCINRSLIAYFSFTSSINFHLCLLCFSLFKRHKLHTGEINYRGCGAYTGGPHGVMKWSLGKQTVERNIAQYIYKEAHENRYIIHTIILLNTWITKYIILFVYLYSILKFFVVSFIYHSLLIGFNALIGKS